MDEVEIRLFSWGTKENKNIQKYLQKKTPKNSNFATIFDNNRNTYSDILAINS